MNPAAPVTTYRTGGSLMVSKDAAGNAGGPAAPFRGASASRLEDSVHAQRVPRVLVHLLRRLVVGDDRGDDVGLVADQPLQRAAVKRRGERRVEWDRGEDG